MLRGIGENQGDAVFRWGEVGFLGGGVHLPGKGGAGGDVAAVFAWVGPGLCPLGGFHSGKTLIRRSEALFRSRKA